MMKNPFFSVVIPLYNKEKYIKKTLESVLTQTFSDFEIIIVDDGSKDKSCEVVESISDPRVCLVHQENGGPSKARNRGIVEAKGQFISFLDADDEWLPEKLLRQHKLHRENPDIVWSCSGYKVVGGIRETIVSYSKDGVLNDAIDSIVDGLSIWTSTVVINKNVYMNKRLFFNENISRSEDIEVWYKLACLYPKIIYIHKPLAIYNIKIDGSLTGTAMKEEDFATLTLKQRISQELNEISEPRKEKLQKKVDALIKGWIIGVWKDKRNFNNYTNKFKPFAEDSLLRVLKLTSFLPRSLKIMILKVIH